MLAELSKDKDSGLLGYRLTLGAGGPLLVQYWNSHEKLYNYASDRNAAHRPAWAAFNRRGSGCGRGLARDLCGRAGRVHLLTHACFGPGGHGFRAGGATG
jgi:hypothetical protein